MFCILFLFFSLSVPRSSVKKVCKPINKKQKALLEKFYKKINATY